MKKFLLLAVIFVLAASSAHAYREDVSMVPILQKSLGIIDLIENDYENEIVRIEFDIVSTSKESYRVLTSDYTYTIVAFGDDRIKDIDVALYKWDGTDWILVKKDNDAEDVALITYTPRTTANYKVVVSAYSFYGSYTAAHYGLIYYHE
ncbi:MAG: hypothetical protein IKX31_11905 [Muribaculaceae bacterium]|nr:hypothetical protein [Muribaculaceae bacterium]